jgi:zinc transport system substrate-binding protein
VVTLFPLEDWVKNITNEQVEVVNIIPDGLEPHDYEPTAADLRLLTEADLVLGVGGGLDDELLDTLPPEKVWRMSEVIASSANDPHVWLSLENARQLVVSLGGNLESLSPGAVSGADSYAIKLTALTNQYETSLAQCQSRDLFVAHDAFHYLAVDYNFNTHPIMGLSADAEPSARALARLTEEARALGVKTIYFETLTSPKLADTLAGELDLEVAVLDPLEGLSAERRLEGASYLGIMEENLNALIAGQRCL